MPRSKTTLELYEHDRHYEMYSSWGRPVDPAMVGCGLVLPGEAAGFIDAIGNTKSVYIHGLRTNPQLSSVKRMRAVLKLADAVTKAAKDAGYVIGVLSTSNETIKSLFAKKHEFVVTNEDMMEGTL